MEICDKNGRRCTVSTKTWGDICSVNIEEKAQDRAEQTTLQFEYDNGKIIVVHSPFPLKHYEQGYEVELVELLEKALLKQSQQSKP